MTAGKLLSALIFPACILFAQTQPAPVTSPIRLDVQALGSGGQPVNDLNASDFQITDENKPVDIVYFRRNTPAQALAPGEFTNHAAPAVAHVSVILLDMMNQQSRGASLDAAKKVARSLATLDSGQFVYLYMLALDGSLLPMHALPEKPSPTAVADTAWTKDAVSQMDAMLKKMPRTMPTGMGNEDKVKKTYVALETLAKQLSAYPVRRNIVWVTDAMPWLTREDVTCSTDFVSCALYVPHLLFVLGRSGAVVTTVSYATMPPDWVRDVEQAAAMTGGRRYENTEIRDVLSDLAAAAGSGYVIAYQPSADNWDSKIHRIRISGKGLKILTTHQRYYASADPTQPAAKQDEVMMSALQSPWDAPDVGLQATVAPVAGNANSIHLQVKVNPADLLMRKDGDKLSDQMSVAVADYTTQGLKTSPTPKTFTIRMTPEQLAKYTKEGLALAQDHPVDPTIQKVRFIVYDNGMNSVGTITVPVTH